MEVLVELSCSIQRILFPALEEEFGELSEKQAEFVRILELLKLEKHMGGYLWVGIGRKPHSRLAMAKAFVAKAVWNLPTTRALLDLLASSWPLRRLCGWDVGALPAECAFSRAFAQFAKGELPQKVHEALIKKHLGQRIVGHVSRDSTAIDGRERPEPKPKPPEPPEPRKRGRPSRDEPPRPAPEPTRLDIQPGRTLEENLADLPGACDMGCKRNPKGHIATWTGFKLHVDVADGDVPLAAILTSASLHDSQAAIPLAQMTFQRVSNLYDPMDAAYDCKAIREHSASLGHVALIDFNARGGQPKFFDPAEKVRFRQRSSAERFNSDIKDNFGGRFVRVRGAAKVMCHLMFGVMCIAARQLFHMLE
jgi:hypothetical protein